jgi:hypothetical protein
MLSWHRVPFKNLIDYLEGGHSLAEFLRQFPTVTHKMAVQALEDAKESLLAPDRMKILLDECLPVDFRYGQLEDLLPWADAVLNGPIASIGPQKRRKVLRNSHTATGSTPFTSNS